MGHIWPNPVESQAFMALLCYKNGSVTRERIRNEVAEGNWDLFNQLLDSTPRGNFGNIDPNTTKILVTGGGSVNMAILQIIADVFNAPVYTQEETKNSAALGSALRARYVFQGGEKVLSFSH